MVQGSRKTLNFYNDISSLHSKFLPVVGPITLPKTLDWTILSSLLL